MPGDLVEEASRSSTLREPTFYARGKTPDGLVVDVVLQCLTRWRLWGDRRFWWLTANVRLPGHGDSIKGRAHLDFAEAKREFDRLVARWELTVS